MKDFTRNNPYFSLCGLNCRLCPMHLSGHCGGCGFGNQSCPIARCSMEHGKPEYCFQCSEYPCERYAHIDEYDSFITHRNQKADLEKMQRIGEEAYNAEQVEKCQILDRLLAEYNDGRKKTLFCLAVNLLPLEDLRTVFEDGDLEIPMKDRVKLMEKCLHKDLHTLYLGIGVGANTPVIIKYPFCAMTNENPKAVYACLNYNEAFCPKQIEKQSICIDGDADTGSLIL